MRKTIDLPCYIGDTVYFAKKSNSYMDKYDYAEITEINITEDGISFLWAQYEYGPDITELWDDGSFEFEDIGKTVFLSREYKIEALEGGGNND